MKFPLSEQKLRAVLEALRELVEPDTERYMNGRLVADVIPQRELSMPHRVVRASKVSMAPATAAACITELARQGWIQEGKERYRTSRWVILEGAYDSAGPD